MSGAAGRLVTETAMIQANGNFHSPPSLGSPRVFMNLTCPPRLGLSGILMVVLATTGCVAARSAGKSAAAGAIAQIVSEESTLVALQRRMADSAGAFLRSEFVSAVVDPARATWEDMRRGVRAETDSVAKHLAIQLRNDLNRSFQELIRTNLDILDTRGPRLARAVADTLTEALGRSLTAQLIAVSDTVTFRFATAVAVGLENVLRPALHGLMIDLRDSLQVRIGDVDRAVAESRTVAGVRYALLGTGIALGLAMLLAAGGYWWRQRRALHAMIDAVEIIGDQGTRDAVHSCAKDAGVHGWLSDRVAARRRTKTR